MATERASFAKAHVLKGRGTLNQREGDAIYEGLATLYGVGLPSIAPKSHLRVALGDAGADRGNGAAD